jgi:hypothetical protein
VVLVIDRAAKAFEFLLAISGEILAFSDMGRIMNKRNKGLAGTFERRSAKKPINRKPKEIRL